MANLTLVIDDELLKRARIRALQEGTSVNAVVREQLDRYAGGDISRSVMAGFLAKAAQSRSGSGPKGRTWTRDSLYER